MKYKVKVPPTRDVGSYSTNVSDSSYRTAAEEALQDYNSVRAHDGFPPVRRMPAGTKYIKIK